MFIILKSANKNGYLLQIRKESGAIDHVTIDPENLYNFLMDLEFQCDLKNEKFIFLMDAKIKSFVADRLETLAKNYTNKSNDA